jgi:choice-of-anchor A domain-containing protein
MTAGKFNTFVFDNFQGSSDTQGRLAVGGNAKLKNGYSVGDRLKNSFTGDSLVVGGNLKYGTGRVYYGNISVGGKARVDQSVAHGMAPGATITDRQGKGNLSVDFSAEQQRLSSLSGELSGLKSTGAASMLWNGMNMLGDGSSDLQVIDVDGSLLSQATYWNTLKSIPDDATILLNISGKNVSLHGDQSVFSQMSSRVLFNFFEARTLKISGISVEGSILAPFADIVFAEGVIQGNLIANSMKGSLQQNLNPFAGYSGGGSAATPEPGTLLLLGSGLAGLVYRTRRKKKTA